jgi:hypothetical protein
VELHGGFGREIVYEIDLDALYGGAPAMAGDTDVADFPFLARVNAADFDYPENVVENDIRFYDRDGKLLAHESIAWNPLGISTFWVRIPSLSKTSSSNRLYLRYDFWIEDSPPMRPVSDVWNSSYVGVWHLDDGAGATEFRDSSGWGNHAVSGVDGILVPTVVAPPAEIGSGFALEVDGTLGDQGFRVGALSDEPTAGQLESYTMSLLLKVDSWDTRYWWEKGDIRTLASAGGRFRHYVFGMGVDQLYEQDRHNWYDLAPTVDYPALAGGWKVFHLTNTGIVPGNTVADGIIKIYNNGRKTGSAIPSSSGSARQGNLGDPIRFFRSSGASSRLSFDELRLSRDVKSPDWIRLEYANINGLVDVSKVGEYSVR